MRKSIIVLLLLTLPGLAQLTKVVKTGLFEVTVPQDWEEHITPTALFLVYPGRDVADPTLENIHIVPSNVSTGMSLDSYAFMAKYEVEQQHPELVMDYSRPVQVGKNQAHRFEYRGLVSGKKFVLVQVMTLVGRKGYTFEFFGSEANFTSFRNSFEQMLRNFRVNP